MEISQDFQEFFGLLNVHNVQYLIVGGYAFAVHARPRFTNDLDIWIQNNPLNAAKVLKVLADFGFEKLAISADDLQEYDKIIQIGYPPLRIDIMTSIDGVEFSDAWKRKFTGVYGNEKVYFIGKEDLIRNKKASGRKIDLRDLEELT